jgi:hypothetical protein
MPPLTLADLPESPERLIYDAVVALIRADTLLSDVFKPIRALETTTREAFLNYGVFSAVIQPVAIRNDDRPSQRSTDHFGIMLSFYLPNEQTEEDTASVGLDLGSYIRKMLWGLAVQDGMGGTYTFATTDFKALTPLIGINGATRILSFVATFETDVDPVTGGFSG